ncbi:MarR family winged helix-turn-helix transcriptional regulator [Streptomyces toxytricini]|uniref:MarR family winged helix-turn-helix transcriptional regulator n=1 Tax=Streptomyces toxytricini TaxID=67369 RepID=UPI00341A67BF
MVCYTVNHAARLLGQAITRRLAALGVTTGQLPTLLALYAADGQTQSELARRTGVEQPTMAVNLRRMERDGLITRTPDPADARRALVHLTDRARTIQTDVQALRSGIDAEALTGFTHEEHTQLSNLLDRLVNNLQHLTDHHPHTIP